MRRNRMRMIEWATVVVLSTAASPPLQAEQPGPSPLIPRAVILADSERGNPRLSPDGRLIAYSASFEGTANLWVQTVGENDARPVTRTRGNGILYGYWRSDSRHLLYFQDSDGDENNHLFQIAIDSGETVDLTPVPGARATGLGGDPLRSDTLFIHLNAREKSLFDLYRLDLARGDLKLEAENPGDVSRFYTDHMGRVRAAYVTRDDNSAEIRVRDDAGDPWRTAISWGGDEVESDHTGFAGFTPGGDSILVVTSLEANAERLLQVDTATGAWKVVSENPRCDIVELMVNPVTNEVEAAGYLEERLARVFFDPGIKDEFEVLGRVQEGDIAVVSRDRTDRRWLVRYSASDRPTDYYHYDRATKEARFLSCEDPKLKAYRLAKKEPLQFRARDGMTIHGYLTLPVDASPCRLPLVVLVHGGPWTRDTWELDFPVQCLANRGYAVLQVNFRGSTGYGKAYQNAGNLQWSGKVITDLLDGKNLLITQGVVDPDRTAICGSSFGGYAALAALAFYPEEFSCGIAYNAISDANLFLASMPAYWTLGRARFETRMGKDPEFLESISPLTRADQVVAPLLLMHNANDVRVKLEHAERMAAALRERGREIEFLVFPRAGHMGGSQANVRKRWAAIEAFLAEHLGGRAEPPCEEESWDDLLR